MDELEAWSRRALVAVRSGSAWERYDFDLSVGASILPVVAAFDGLTNALGLDCADACALLYVPVDECDQFPSLASLDPWQDILVPQVYILTPSTAAAWMDRTEMWTPRLHDVSIGEGLTMRGLTVEYPLAGVTDTHRHLVLRREMSTPTRFDTLD